MASGVKGHADLERALGLTGARFGERGRFDWPTKSLDRDSALARARESVLPLLAAAGLRAELGANRIVSLELAPGLKCQTHSLPADRPSMAQLRPGGIDIEATGRGAVSLLLENGRGVLLEFDRAGLTCTLLETSAPWLAEADPPIPDVVGWAEASGDTWLRQRLADCLQSTGLWRKAVAVGLLVRLREPSPDPDGARPIERVIRGVADPADVEAFAWARKLRDDVVMAIDDEVVRECEALGTVLGELRKSLAHGLPLQLDVLLEVCRRRDEIEAVFQLLGQRAPTGYPRDKVTELDRQGRTLMAQLTLPVDVVDEHLERVVTGAALAWWTVPVQAFSPDGVESQPL